MSNLITTKVKQSAGDLARKAAKAAHEEKEGFVRTAKVAAVGEQKPTTSGLSVIDQIITGNGTVKEVKSEEEQKLHSEIAKRMSALEEELAAIRGQRTQRDENWSQEQDKLMQTDREQDKGKPLVMPISRPRRGAPMHGGKPKGMEGIKQKK